MSDLPSAMWYACREARLLRNDVRAAARIARAWRAADPRTPTRIYGATVVGDLGERRLAQLGLVSAVAMIDARIATLRMYLARR